MEDDLERNKIITRAFCRGAWLAAATEVLVCTGASMIGVNSMAVPAMTGVVMMFTALAVRVARGHPRPPEKHKTPRP